ncbi:MAG TPA: heme-binding protein [Devosiaceae bacterium]|nr:heme-binding protein [Devosiaceae bacterium]
MSTITLTHASTIIEAARAKGRELSFEPLTVVVLDGGGHIIAVQREDGSGILRFELAFGKAYGALGFGTGSRTLAGRAAKVPSFISAASVAAEGRLIPAPGGVLVRDADGGIIGAVGISGDTGDNDEICAVAGIESAGFRADPGA